MKLELFSGREPHIITLEIDGKKQDLKVPTDFTVEEVERIIEIEENLEKKEGDLMHRYNLIFAQLAIAFGRYQPEMTAEKLKKVLTREQALQAISFIATNSFVSKKNDDGTNVGEKKNEQAS